MKLFVLYCLVGFVNTGVGFGAIFFLTFLGVLPELANFLGYAMGILCSYVLNKNFTFKNKEEGNFFLFTVAMGISYLLNLLALIVALRGFGLGVYVAQILAGTVYTLSGFFLSRFWVWRLK